MKHVLCSLAMSFLLIGLSGCGGGGAATPESLLKESIGLMDQLSGAFEGAKNADDAKPKVDKLAAQFSDLKKKIDALKIPDSVNKELEKKHGPEMEKAVKRLMSASMGLAMKDPQGMEKLGESMKTVFGGGKK